MPLSYQLQFFALIEIELFYVRLRVRSSVADPRARADGEMYLNGHRFHPPDPAIVMCAAVIRRHGAKFVTFIGSPCLPSCLRRHHTII